MGMCGDLNTGYNGELSRPGGSSHGLGIRRQWVLQGSFYNPNFLSFSAQPYYNRSQSNSDSGSIFDSSGYNGNVSLFSGSHFPGSISFGQVWDSTGIYGIPGETGLTTKDSSRNFGIGWSAIVPGLPTLVGRPIRVLRQRVPSWAAMRRATSRLDSCRHPERLSA